MEQKQRASEGHAPSGAAAAHDDADVPGSAPTHGGSYCEQPDSLDTGLMLWAKWYGRGQV